MSTLQRLTSPVTIGRQEQLAFVRQQLATASTGTGRAVLIEAEAGFGKSRLVADLVADARELGMAALVGRCFESAQGIAFAPFTDLLSSHITQHETATGDHFPSDLALLLPHVRLGADPVRSEASSDNRFRHERILRGISQFVDGLARTQPLLLVIEDLHWIDDASLAALDLLARRLDSLPLLMLLTCRAEEAPPRVRHAIAGLRRDNLASTVGLEPLTFPDALTFVRSLFGLDRGPGSAFVHALHALAGGNPFFMEEILAVLVASGDIFRSGQGWERKALDDLRIPRSVQDAVAIRLAALGDRARRTLEVAAILGQRFEVSLLAELAGENEPDLLEALRELVDAALIVEESADEFQFRHALIRQAVESGLLQRERRSLHRAAMEALAARARHVPGDELVDELARHAYAAGAWEESLAYAGIAGKQALSMGAPQAAIGHFDRAVDAASHLGAEPPGAVIHGRAKALDTIGDFEAARADYERAERLAHEAGSVRDEWEAALDLGFLWCSRDYAAARPYFDRALEVARASGEDHLVAHSLNRIGNWLVNANEPGRGLAHHLEALEIFRRVGDRRGEAQSLDMASMAHTIGGDLISASRLNREVISLFRELEDRIGEAGNHGPFMANVFYSAIPVVGAGTMQAMREHAARSVEIAREANWVSGEAYATALLATATFVGGNLGEGLDGMREAYDLATSIGHQAWMIQISWNLAHLLMDLDQVDEAAVHLARARNLAHEIHGKNWIMNTTASLAIARVRQGDLGAAADLLGMVDKSLGMKTQGERLLWLAQGWRRLAEGRPDDAIGIADGLYRSATNLADESDVPVLALLKASALLAIDRPDPALSLLDSAIETAMAEGGATIESQLRILRVSAFDALGRRDEALRERDAAVRCILAMAETLPRATKDIYVGSAMASLPPGYRGARRTSRVGELTPRETEVAGLIAAGLTNREIGERLFIAERTAESHVASIMRKLGFSARAQIAAWTVDHDRRGT